MTTSHAGKKQSTSISWFEQWRPWLVCLTGSLLFFYEFVQLNIPNAFAPYLEAAFHLDGAQLGALSSTYFWADASLVFVAGLLLDRFSTRKLILVSMLLCAFGTLGFALSHSVVEAGIFRAITGIGGAFCFLSNMRLASRWFPVEKLALITGCIVTMAMLGGMVAQTPMLWLIAATHSWRTALVIDAAVGLLIIILIYWVVYDYPKGYHQEHHRQKQAIQHMGLLRSIGLALRNANNWFAGLYTSLLNLPIFLLGAIYGISYLHQVRHFSVDQASDITAMIFFGTVVGSPIMGWLSDKFQNRRKPMLLGALSSLICIAVLVYVPHLSYGALACVFFALGLLTSAQIISYPTVVAHNQKSITATAVSIVSFMAIMGGAVMQPIFGRLLDWGWNGLRIHGVPLYTAAEYHHALMLMLVGFAVAVFCVWRLKEPTWD